MTQSVNYDVDAIKKHLLNRLEGVLKYLYPKGRKNGKEFEIGNLQGDEGKSMKIALEGERAGLWIDHATGDSGDIFNLWADKHGLCIHTNFPAVIKSIADWFGIQPFVTHNKTQQNKQKYIYYSIVGEEIAYIERSDNRNGKTYKCYDLLQKQFKATDIRPLYNLPNIAKNNQVILVEGEKCADALNGIGYCATTAMFGANAPIEKTDWSPLKDKKVIIWADHDEPGYKYAKRVSEHLRTICTKITVLEPPKNKPEKWDAADAVHEGIDVENYLNEHLLNPRLFLKAYTLEQLLNDKSPMPKDIIAPRLLTESGLLLLGGAPKVGKTDFLITMLVYMAIGKEFLGFKPKHPLKIILIQAEIPYDYIRERFQSLGLTEEEIAIAGKNLLVTDQFKKKLDNESIQELADLILEYFPDRDVDIICFDPLYNIFDGGQNNASENDNQAMFDFLQNKIFKLLDMINPKAGVMLSHHTKKIDKKHLIDDPFQAFSGASSLRRFYSTGIIMYHPEEHSPHRHIVFELRNGPSLPLKTVIKKDNAWHEIDPNSDRIINANYGSKLDKERDRKRDVILQILAEESLKGNLYGSAKQFSETFENKSGLGGCKTIRDRISVLATKGHIKFVKDAKHLGISGKGSKFGLLCVKDMEFLQGEEVSIILPTHYKCPQSGVPLPVENPNVWVVQDDE